jgi:hypothetical protein
MRVYYKDYEGNEREICKVMTNHSMTIDEALNLCGVDMDKWAEEQGWDDWDFEDIYSDYEDE